MTNEPTHASQSEALKRYFELVRRYPEMFSNSDDAGYTILLDDASIAEVSKRAQVGVVYQDAYMTVVRDAVRFPNGSIGPYVRITKPGGKPGVVALAVHGGNVVLINHYRHATRRWHLETPRGFSKPDLSIEENLAEELLEEIGAVAIKPAIALGLMYTDNGMGTGAAELFYVEVEFVDEGDGLEAIRNRSEYPPTSVATKIAQAEIDDAFTIAAFARARFRGLL